MCSHKHDHKGINHGQGCQCPGFKMERFIQPCLLLLVYEKPSYGYELMEKLSEFGFQECIDPGAVYRNLRKMEEDGWIKSKWDTEGSGPAKRLYTVTGEGEEAIHAWAGHMKRQIKRLEYFLERYKKSFQGKI